MRITEKVRIVKPNLKNYCSNCNEGADEAHCADVVGKALLSHAAWLVVRSLCLQRGSRRFACINVHNGKMCQCLLDNAFSGP
jgi:hypothetical protein